MKYKVVALQDLKRKEQTPTSAADLKMLVNKLDQPQDGEHRMIRNLRKKQKGEEI